MNEKELANGRDKSAEGAHLVPYPDFPLSPGAPGTESDALALRRIELEERRLAFEEKKSTAEALTALVDRFFEKGKINEDVRDSFHIAAVEHLTGRQLDELKPKAPDGVWLSPTQIAEKLGSTAAMVGRTLTKLELRDTEHERKIVNKAEGRDKTVTSSLWDDEAFARVRAELLRRGKIKDEQAS